MRQKIVFNKLNATLGYRKSKMINLCITVLQGSSIKLPNGFLGGSIVEIMLIKECKSMKDLKTGDRILGDIIIQKNSSFF
jgi:hypothetical protein